MRLWCCQGVGDHAVHHDRRIQPFRCSRGTCVWILVGIWYSRPRNRLEWLFTPISFFIYSLKQSQAAPRWFQECRVGKQICHGQEVTQIYKNIIKGPTLGQRCEVSAAKWNPFKNSWMFTHPWFPGSPVLNDAYLLEKNKHLRISETCETWHTDARTDPAAFPLPCAPGESWGFSPFPPKKN